MASETTFSFVDIFTCVLDDLLTWHEARALHLETEEENTIYEQIYQFDFNVTAPCKRKGFRTCY